MAKIVYGLSGEGSGHSSRSKEMIRYLQKQGHTVKVTSYDRGYRNLKDEFDILEIEGLSFVIEDNKISFSRTFTENLMTISKRYESSNVLKEKYFKEFKPDCVISDFEPMTAYFAMQYDIPLISIDNQHRIRYIELDYPNDMVADAILVENLIRLMVPRPDVTLITTFYFGKLKNERSFLFPPIMRREVLDLQPKEEDYVLVYTNSGYDALLQLLQTYQREKFIVYGEEEEGDFGNVTCKKPSKSGFLKDLANCKAVIGTAGFTLMTEAFYLKKPFLAFPLGKQFEQEYNAYLLNKVGYGYAAKSISKEVISAFLYDLPEYKQNLASYAHKDNSEIQRKLDELLSDEGALLKKYHDKRRIINWQNLFDLKD
jgi:uncharacterized protein (TIGR00661 family)